MMSHMRYIGILVIMLLLLTAFTSSASEFISGSDKIISKNEIISDDVYFYGDYCDSYGTITGDLIAFCYNITSEGETNGSANLFGRFVSLGGKTGNSARLFGQYIDIYGNIDGSLLAFGQEINMEKNVTVARSAHCYADVIVIEGDIGEDTELSGGSVLISGRIDGDVKIKAEDITIASSAIITGDLEYQSGSEAFIDNGAQIDGRVRWDELIIDNDFDNIFSVIGPIFRVTMFFITLITGLFIILLFRYHTRESSNQIQHHFWKSLGVGFLGMMLFSFGALILIILVVSIPIGIMLLFLGGVLFYIGKIYVSIVIGRLLFGLLSSKPKLALGWEFIIGLVILTILFQMPYLGSIIYLFTFIVGMGGAICGYLALSRKYKESEAEADITPAI
jgi:hypothetical protein